MVRVKSETSDWIYGNIIFAAIPGCFVDSMTRGGYDLVPGTIDIHLVAETTSNRIDMIDRNVRDELKTIRLLNASGETESTINISIVD